MEKEKRRRKLLTWAEGIEKKNPIRLGIEDNSGEKENKRS